MELGQKYQRHNKEMEYLVEGSSARQPYIEDIPYDVEADLAEDTEKRRGAYGISTSYWKVFCIAIVISLSLTVCNLVLQFKDVEKINAIESYRQQTVELQLQTSQLMDRITEQYDYNSIKETAQENNMAVDDSRVRNVGE